MDKPYSGKNLQQKLGMLQDAGLDRDKALEVLRYHIHEQHQATGQDTLADALGPDFDAGFYDRMKGDHWLTHWHEFYLSELRDAFPEVPEEAASGSMGYSMRALGYAAMFLTMAMAVLGCGGSQDDAATAPDGPGTAVPEGPRIVVPEPVFTPGEFRVHEFTYEHEGRTYRLNLMTEGPEARDLASAVEQVKRDDVMALLTIGCEKDVRERIYEIVRKLHRLNPGLMRELEPVVIRLDPESSISTAGPNITDDIVSELGRTGTKRTEKGDYGKYCEWYVQDVDMPEDQEDFERMMRAIKARYLSPGRGDCLDVISSGIGTKESLVHEFGHLVTMENPEVYYMMLQWLKGTVPNIRIGRSLWTQDYAGMRWREVESWVEKRMEDMERKVDEEVKKPGIHPRIRSAIRSFGSREEALKRYRELMDEGTLYFKYTEDLAEGMVDFFFETLTYVHDVKMCLQCTGNDSGYRFFADFHRELVAELEEARKAGDQQKARELEKKVQEDQAFLDKVRRDNMESDLRFRRRMASLAVEDLMRGDIRPSGGDR